MTFSVEKQRNLLQGNGKKPMCGHICTATNTTNFTKFLHNTTLFERFPAMLGSRRKKLTLPESNITLDKKASQKESIVFQPSIWLHKDTTTPPGFHFSTPIFSLRLEVNLPPATIFWIQNWWCFQQLDDNKLPPGPLKTNGGLYGGFLKWWYPTTMGFPTKNDQQLGCEMGVPPFKETPIQLVATNARTQHDPYLGRFNSSTRRSLPPKTRGRSTWVLGS